MKRTATWVVDDLKLLKLRVLELSFARQGRPSEEWVKIAMEKLLAHYPAPANPANAKAPARNPAAGAPVDDPAWRLNRELCQLLIWLSNPELGELNADLAGKKAVRPKTGGIQSPEDWQSGQKGPKSPSDFRNGQKVVSLVTADSNGRQSNVVSATMDFGGRQNNVVSVISDFGHDQNIVVSITRILEDGKTTSFWSLGFWRLAKQRCFGHSGFGT